METSLRQVQPVLAFAASHREEDLSLTALAERAGLSTFHLHRLFLAAAGETPKQFTLRLRLERAALLLLRNEESVLNVALECGFESHEAFSRAFRRHYGTTPRQYRARGLARGISVAQLVEHAALVTSLGPCIRLFHSQRSSTETTMQYSITTKEVAPQPVLVVRRRVKPSEIATTLGTALGQVFQHAQRIGAALAGQPFTRYLEWGPGLMTIEAGMPVATPGSSEGDVTAETLPGGRVATTIHTGAYDKLTEAHAALQVWIEAQGLASNGAPWEIYVTDPADYPDPKDWKTEVCWPVG
ncbi:MAG TPA: AraC family transcriptional regulator [Bryobacteraceae bacterium]|jgi:AraC-like DNA-binding protein/effector-binding domain-containing protein